MKAKLFVFVSTLLLVQSLVFASNVQTHIHIPDSATENDNITINILTNSDTVFDVAFYVPPEIDLVANPDEIFDRVFDGKKYSVYHWRNEREISTSFKAKAGEWDFVTVVTYPGGFRVIKRELYVSKKNDQSEYNSLTGHIIYGNILENVSGEKALNKSREVTKNMDYDLDDNTKDIGISNKRSIKNDKWMFEIIYKMIREIFSSISGNA